jgi:hypothetical protein
MLPEAWARPARSRRRRRRWRARSAGTWPRALVVAAQQACASAMAGAGRQAQGAHRPLLQRGPHRAALPVALLPRTGHRLAGRLQARSMQRRMRRRARACRRTGTAPAACGQYLSDRDSLSGLLHVGQHILHRKHYARRHPQHSRLQAHDHSKQCGAVSASEASFVQMRPCRGDWKAQEPAKCYLQESATAQGVQHINIRDLAVHLDSVEDVAQWHLSEISRRFSRLPSLRACDSCISHVWLYIVQSGVLTLESHSRSRVRVRGRFNS